MIAKITNRIDKFFLLLQASGAQRRLAREKYSQKVIFEGLRHDFSNIYYKIKKIDKGNKFTTPLWENYGMELEKVFLPKPPFSFLKEPVIIKTMFVSAGGDWLKKELSFIKTKISKDRLKVLLEEDLVGDPPILNREFSTSHNSVHHLYSIVKFLDKTNCDLGKVNYIVEWGGGYGNMSKIFKRLKSESMTYVIIDTPVVSCIQWLYLATVFGLQNVNLIQDSSDAVIDGKINLLPVCFVDNYEIKADLFISTWALSESSTNSQDLVISSNFFNAEHLLIAWHDNNSVIPDSERVLRPAVKLGAIMEDIEFLPGNHYAFR